MVEIMGINDSSTNFHFFVDPMVKVWASVKKERTDISIQSDFVTGSGVWVHLAKIRLAISGVGWLVVIWENLNLISSSHLRRERSLKNVSGSLPE